MTPLQNRVFIQQDALREYLNGIIVPASKGIVESQAQLGRIGTITALGPNIDADQLRIGDRVLYGEFEYPKTPDGHIILSDQDICGVLDVGET